MTTLKSDFLKIMTERGFMHQCSDLEGLDKLAADNRVVAYVGYDCTAPSLHVGSLIIDHDAELASEVRRQTHRIDGWRNDPGGRPFGQGRNATAPLDR